MPRAPDHTGRLVAGRYHLLAIIGEGGFGRVYRAMDARLDAPVAVKIINPWWAQDPEWVERFAQEAKTAAGIRHPGVVQVTDTGIDSKLGPYTVAELVDGESLRSLLDREGALSPSRAADIAAQAADAVAAAHDRGVVHRDVKPGNLLVDGAGRVRVCDFGIARLQTGATKTSAAHTLVGTPAYMAPEQARGKATGPPADQYALGVVLFEMLAGRPPFDGDTPVAVALAHLSDETPELPDDVPAPLRDTVRRTLAKDPGDRYSDARALAQALRVAPTLATQPIDNALAPTRLVAPRRQPHPRRAAASRIHGPSRKRRRVVAGSAALLVLAAGGAAAAALLNGSHGAEHALGREANAIQTSDTAAATVTPERTTEPVRINVPSVTGLSEPGARARIQRRRLAFDSVRRASVRQPAGRVVSQRPAAGQKARPGQTVQVTVSDGPPPVSVPTLESDNAAEAQNKLSRSGLAVGATRQVASARPAGMVLDTEPSAGTNVPRGSTVTLIVARPKTWRTVGTYSFDSDGQTPRFTIHAQNWRITYTMNESCSYESVGPCIGTSLLLMPSYDSLDLSKGTHTTAIAARPGRYYFEFSSQHAATLKLAIEEFS
jgi:hypothetical protein